MGLAGALVLVSCGPGDPPLDPPRKSSSETSAATGEEPRSLLLEGTPEGQVPPRGDSDADRGTTVPPGEPGEGGSGQAGSGNSGVDAGGGPGESPTGGSAEEPSAGNPGEKPQTGIPVANTPTERKVAMPPGAEKLKLQPEGLLRWGRLPVEVHPEALLGVAFWVVPSGTEAWTIGEEGEGERRTLRDLLIAPDAKPLDQRGIVAVSKEIKRLLAEADVLALDPRPIDPLDTTQGFEIVVVTVTDVRVAPAPGASAQVAQKARELESALLAGCPLKAGWPVRRNVLQDYTLEQSVRTGLSIDGVLEQGSRAGEAVLVLQVRGR
mgnify:CR=1 FL=1